MIGTYTYQEVVVFSNREIGTKKEKKKDEKELKFIFQRPKFPMTHSQRQSFSKEILWLFRNCSMIYCAPKSFIFPRIKWTET